MTHAVLWGKKVFKSAHKEIYVLKCANSEVENCPGKHTQTRTHTLSHSHTPIVQCTHTYLAAVWLTHGEDHPSGGSLFENDEDSAAAWHDTDAFACSGAWCFTTVSCSSAGLQALVLAQKEKSEFLQEALKYVASNLKKVAVRNLMQQ